MAGELAVIAWQVLCLAKTASATAESGVEWMLGCWGREVFAEGSIVLPGAGLALFTTLNPIPGLAVCTHFYDKMTNVVTEWMFSKSPWTAGTGWGGVVYEPHWGITLFSEKLLIWGLAQRVLTTCKVEWRSQRF